MRRIWLAAVAVLAFVPASPAQDKPPETPREEAKQSLKGRYDSLVKEYQDARREYSEAYQKAKTNEERQKINKEKYPIPAKYAGRMLKLAEEDPSGPVGFDALSWIVTESPSSSQAPKAAELLVEHHLRNKKFEAVWKRSAFRGTESDHILLRAVMEKSDDRRARAEATMGEATIALRFSNRKGDAEAAKRARELFETIVEKYGDIEVPGGTMGELAKTQLATIGNIEIDKPAPEITGEDVDGKPLKLSDYKGKVVVLDFWGHW